MICHVIKQHFTAILTIYCAFYVVKLHKFGGRFPRQPLRAAPHCSRNGPKECLKHQGPLCGRHLETGQRVDTNPIKLYCRWQITWHYLAAQRAAYGHVEDKVESLVIKDPWPGCNIGGRDDTMDTVVDVPGNPTRRPFNPVGMKFPAPDSWGSQGFTVVNVIGR